MKKEIFTVKQYLFCIAVCIVLFATATKWLITGQAYESTVTMTLVVIAQAIASYATGGALVCGLFQNYVEPYLKLKK